MFSTVLTRVSSSLKPIFLDLSEHYTVEKDPLAYVKKIGMELSTLYDDTIYLAKGDVVHSYLAYRSTK